MSSGCSVLIVNYWSREALAQCLRTIPTEEGPVEVIIVNNSPFERVDDLAGETRAPVTVMNNPVNVGFALAVNQAARRASYPFLLLLNPDTRLRPGCLEQLLKLLADIPAAAAAGPLTHYPDGRLQPTRGKFPGILSSAAHLFQLKRLMPKDEWVIARGGRLLGGLFAQYRPLEQRSRVDYVSGACLCVRRQAFDRAGGMDGRFFLFYEEIDLCRRLAEAGGETWFVGDATAEHEVGHSSAVARQRTAFERQRSMRLYLRRHGTWWQRTAVFFMQLLAAELRLARCFCADDRQGIAAELRLLRWLSGRSGAIPESTVQPDSLPVIISACLLGRNCTYRGDSNFREWTNQPDAPIVWIPVCPEIEGGLSTPRPPAEIQQGDGEAVLDGRAQVRMITGEDVTAAYIAGAETAVCRALRYNCRLAILKARSPSCSPGMIYDGTHSGALRPGTGVAAAALRAVGLRVVSDEQAGQDGIAGLLRSHQQREAATAGLRGRDR